MKTYKLLGADGKEHLSETPGSRQTSPPSCFVGELSAISGHSSLLARLRRKITSTIRRFPRSYEKSRVFFADERAALAAGYRPCGNCLLNSVLVGYSQDSFKPSTHLASSAFPVLLLNT